MDLTNVKMSMNPFCEIAVEVRARREGYPQAGVKCQHPRLRLACSALGWPRDMPTALRPPAHCTPACPLRAALHAAAQEAIRLKEKKLAEEVVAISIGPKQCQVWVVPGEREGGGRAGDHPWCWAHCRACSHSKRQS